MPTETPIRYSLNRCECPLPTTNWAAGDDPHNYQPGTLTTDHPASSYGQPVIVSATGQAYGPGEAHIVDVARGEIADRIWFTTSTNQRWDCEPIAGRLLLAAHRAGFAEQNSNFRLIAEGFVY